MSEKLKDIDLRSEEVQEILTQVPHWMIRWGSVLFLSLIVMLLGITYFVKYPDTIQSQALITTKVPPQKEFAKTTGELQFILIEDNELVERDQPLAIIENTANYKDVYALKSIVDTIKINSKSFSFPIEQLPILFLGDIDSQYTLFENSYIQYTLNKQLQPFSNEAAANSFSISELKTRLKNLQSQKEINKTEVDFKQKELQRHKTLFEKGITSAQVYENKQLELAQIKRNYKNFETAISQARQSISDANKISKGNKITQVKEELLLLKNVIQSFNQLKKAVKDWENRYVLKSNINGSVSFLNYWNANQTVNQGDLVFTIIPNENSSYIAKLRTPALNSGKIKKGQKVNLKLENYLDTEFGVLQGTVQSISLIPDEQGLYFIDVSLPKRLITSYNKEIEFKHEMRASGEIITEDLRLIERFFYQFKNLLNR